MSQGIPEGYHSITPHLVVKDAAAVTAFYKEIFGATELYTLKNPKTGGFMHGELKIGNSIIMLGEEAKEQGCLSAESLNGSPVVLHLYVENVDELFAKITAAGGQVKMPLNDMFWGDRYGQVVDPFGQVWALATRVRNLSPQEMQAGMEAAFCGV